MSTKVVISCQSKLREADALERAVLPQACLSLALTATGKHTRASLESLPLQMSAAGLEKQIQQATAAVSEAEAAHKRAGGSNKELHSQLLLAREKALELRVERLIQQSVAKGNMCMAPLHIRCI